jgi:hypothetical protein
MVARTSFMSCRSAPSTTTPMGTPCPSTRKLRLTPHLPRSVGLRPVFSRPTAPWSGPVHGEPVPVDPAQLFEPLDSRVP